MNKMLKEWFIFVDEKEEGPFSISQLKCDKRITPDTLARHINSVRWQPIKQIPELKEVFKDEESQPLIKETDKSLPRGDELAIDVDQDPSPWLYFLLLLAIILTYVFYQLFWK